MQTALSRIWPQVTDSISYNNYQAKWSLEEAKLWNQYQRPTIITKPWCIYAKVGYLYIFNDSDSTFISSRNTSDILNCHLCGATEFRQVAMVLLYLPNDNHLFFSDMIVTIRVSVGFKTSETNCYTESFSCSFHGISKWYCSR